MITSEFREFAQIRSGISATSNYEPRINAREAWASLIIKCIPLFLALFQAGIKFARTRTSALRELARICILRALCSISVDRRAINGRALMPRVLSRNKRRLYLSNVEIWNTLLMKLYPMAWRPKTKRSPRARPKLCSYTDLVCFWVVISCLLLSFHATGKLPTAERLPLFGHSFIVAHLLLRTSSIHLFSAIVK